MIRARAIGAWLGLAVTVGRASTGCVPSPAVPPQSPQERMATRCGGVPEAERARPAFLQAGGVEAVRPLMGERHYLKYSVPELRGAGVYVRALPGMTEQWIARVTLCHLAWEDAAASRNAEDPLSVGAPELSFETTETGFLIRIAGRDKSEGAEILRRAQRLGDPHADAAR